MTEAKYREFLLRGTKTGKLATVRKDGRPHVVPVWFELDGDAVIFPTSDRSVKFMNMKHDPRVSITIDDQTPPYSYVMIEGTVSFSEDPGELLYWATRIGGRYMGEDQAEAYGRRNSTPGEVIVRIIPSKVSAFADVAGW
ncbi:MAG TPA: PPOX class F420-dependent oxidoreductase [Thermodesulfobacteriota bacterium]|nr:PPOX class F420-dependent oxidoreductase [Thermodesulfobacteriota bacterium]